MKYSVVSPSEGAEPVVLPEGETRERSEYYPSLKSYHVGYTLRTVGEMHEFMNSVVAGRMPPLARRFWTGYSPRP